MFPDSDRRGTGDRNRTRLETSESANTAPARPAIVLAAACAFA